MKPSPEAWARVGHVLARLYREETDREQQAESKDAA